ncbi:hypothetical protein BDZ88DRAFT_409400 [Geranomyces variabilis]|nr:hypothetical protein BDZ88DRAFT_409400 [Geranomyces variabilis]
MTVILLSGCIPQKPTISFTISYCVRESATSTPARSRLSSEISGVPLGMCTVNYHLPAMRRYSRAQGHNEPASAAPPMHPGFLVVSLQSSTCISPSRSCRTSEHELSVKCGEEFRAYYTDYFTRSRLGSTHGPQNTSLLPSSADGMSVSSARRSAARATKRRGRGLIFKYNGDQMWRRPEMVSSVSVGNSVLCGVKPNALTASPFEDLQKWLMPTIPAHPGDPGRERRFSRAGRVAPLQKRISKRRAQLHIAFGCLRLSTPEVF